MMKIDTLIFCTVDTGVGVEHVFGRPLRKLLVELGCRSTTLNFNAQTLEALELLPTGTLAQALAPYENIDCQMAVIEISFNEKRELSVRVFEKKHLEPNEPTVDLTTAMVNEGDTILCGRFIIEASNSKYLLLRPNGLEPWLASVVPARYRVSAQELLPENA